MLPSSVDIIIKARSYLGRQLESNANTDMADIQSPLLAGRCGINPLNGIASKKTSHQTCKLFKEMGKMQPHFASTIPTILCLLTSTAHGNKKQKPDATWAKDAARYMRQTGGKAGAWADESFPWPHGNADVNWQDPPAWEQNIPEPSCSENWKHCASVTWQRRLEFAESPFPPQFKLMTELFKDRLPKPNVTLSLRRQTVAWMPNPRAENVTIKVDGISQNITYPDKWLARADLVHDAVKNDTSIVFSESPSQHVEPYNKEIKRKFICGPHELCAVQTLTFHAALAGICRPRPRMICKKEGIKEDLCKPLEMKRRNQYADRIKFHRFDSCDQWNIFIWDSCYAQGSQGPLPEKCSLPSIPLSYEGKPVFVLRFVRSKMDRTLAGHSKRAISDERDVDWSELVDENDMIEEEISMIDDED
ncbi:hypothetical protein L249_6653 [Ophiocordyceps polyrhachis-furcata BCC 54312]|uniref:Uncharacterized protein n=1 Tax=Ophiocordyceps polyrhachis-furcata BCC 54312 TaxID=1330021 RepID=A0A367LL09_9HYPO|nr:hypothetical protein L249_6653 [Ophiocordyceps polyrhachis-furcata BCC 54312]